MKIIILFSLVMASANLQAATYYVATTGTDNASCGTSVSPCKTVNYTLSNKVAASDTIRIKPGTYFESVTAGNTTKNLNIIITGDDPQNRPHFHGSWRVAHRVTGVTIKDVRIEGDINRGGIGPEWAGIITINAPRTTIDNVEVWDGIGLIGITTSKQVVIRNSYLHHAGLTEPCGGIDQHGISVTNWNEDPAATNWDEALIFENNKIHNVEGDGIQELGQVASLDDGGTEVTTKYVIIRNNEIYNACEQGLDFKGTQYVKIYGNNIYNNGYGGVSTNDEDGNVEYKHLHWWVFNNKIHGHDNFALFSQEGDDGNWFVWNNQFYNNCKNPTYDGCAAVSQPPPNSIVTNNVFYNNNSQNNNKYASAIESQRSNVLIKNNIFYNNGLGSKGKGNIHSSTNAVISNNYVYPASPGITGSNAITANDPKFVNAAALDFRLQSASPAKGVGVVIAGSADFTINLDFVGSARPSSNWDLGIYSGSGTTQPPLRLSAPKNLRVQ